MSVVDETVQERPRSSPTLLTPTNQSKRRPVFARSSQLTSRRRIFSSPAAILTAAPAQQRPDDEHFYKRTNGDNWKESEVKALVEFVLFHSHGSWPTHHQQNFWEAAAMHIKMRASTERSGIICMLEKKIE